MKDFFIYLFLLLSIKSVTAQEQPIQNIVFEGAGIRGIAYSGVIKVLEDKNMIKDIRKVAGTSAGAITALMLSLGYTSIEMYSIISGTRFQKFNDGKFFFFGGIPRFVNKYGWYRTNEFEKWLGKLIYTKTGNKDITFRQLKNQGHKELYITGTCLNKQSLVVFSDDTYPDMKVIDAVKISMSIPLYFVPTLIDDKGKVYKKNNSGKALDLMVDGGIIGNFPIDIFDSLVQQKDGKVLRVENPKTIGVRIDSDDQIEQDKMNNGLVSLEVHNLSDYVFAFYNIVLENLNRHFLTPGDWQRTISVSSVDIGPRIKKLSVEQKQSLMESGEKCTKEYFLK